MVSDSIANNNKRIKLPKASSAALRGKQSIRASFKLSESCIDAINIVATHMGIKQKSLFDHLIEDADMLKSIARGRSNAELGQKDTMPKTFVINRNSMDVLSEVSAKTGISKENLIELSVQRLLPIIAKEQVTHEERKKVMTQINSHLKQGEKIHIKIKKLFGRDDIIFQRYEQIISNYHSCAIDIQNYIEKSRNIEKFTFDD